MASVVTLTEAKKYLQVDYDGQDTVIQIILNGSESFIESYLGVRIYDDEESASVEETLDGGMANLYPTSLPVNGVTSIVDADDDDEEFTSDYKFNRSCIFKSSEAKWSSGRLRWKVTYNGGYSVTTLPAGIKDAIMVMAYLKYHEDRSMDWGALMPLGLKNQLQPFRLSRSIG